jgi:hypothetical protein
VGFAVFLWWDCRQRQMGRRELVGTMAWFAAGFAAVLLLVNGYFIWQAGPARFFWCTVVFLLKYYPQQADWNTFQVIPGSFHGGSGASHLLRLYETNAKTFFDIAATPCICCLVLARYFWKRGKKSWEDWNGPVLVATVGMFLFLSMSPAPAAYRILVSSLPAFILLGWLVDAPGKLPRAVVVLCGVVVIVAVTFSVFRSRPREIGVWRAAQGKIGYSDDDEVLSEYEWVQQHTRPGDFFYEAAFSDIYFYLDLRNPTPLPRITNNGYTTPAQVNDVIDGLERHQTRYIAWTTSYLDSVPNWENPSDAHLQPLRDYIRSHYELVKVFSDSGDEIWQRDAQ